MPVIYTVLYIILYVYISTEKNCYFSKWTNDMVKRRQTSGKHMQRSISLVIKSM